MTKEPENPTPENPTSEPKPTPPGNNADDQLDNIASSMPPVVPEAVDAAIDKDRKATEAQSAAVDKKGNTFDPARHAVDGQGVPIMTPTGRFKLLPRALKQPAGSGPGRVTMPPEQVLTDPNADVKVVAATITGLFIQFGVGFFGDEWLPEKSREMDEETNLRTVTERYCEAINLRDLPPGIVCVVAYGMYALRRFTRPVTKSRLAKIGDWIKVRWTNFTYFVRNRKHPAAKTPPEKVK